MIVTDEKIKVSEEMMFNEGLSRMLISGQLGIPESDSDKGNIVWKDFNTLTEEDFEKIESYFLFKSK